MQFKIATTNTEYAPQFLEAHWCSGCDASKGNLLHKVETEKFKPLESFCHSNCIRGFYLKYPDFLSHKVLWTNSSFYVG